MWARTFKARYFPHSSFLDAKLGSRASDTQLWVDRWLPSLPLGHPTPSYPTNVTLNTKVSSLICSSTRTWDIDFLRPFISEEDVNAICNTPLGNCSRWDRLIWTSNKNGQYSVRSGYHWIHSSRGMARAPLSLVPSNSEDSTWKAIWKIKAPPKIRNFLWRAVSEALATMGGLYTRKSASSPLCPICKNQEESVLHMLLRCPWVEPIWFGGQLDAGYYFFLLGFLFGGACPIVPFPGFLQTGSSLVPPTAPFIKINVDASWFLMDRRATLAAVLQDHNGHFVAAHKLCIGARSVVFAEAMALLKGCELTVELGFRWIVAESDSLEVVSSLKGDISHGSWEVFLILENILRLGTSFQGCRWSWVPRLANQSADRLASRTNLETCDKTWVRRPPSSLVHIINKDGLPCPP
ncbi:hypothetical protein ACFX2G_028665 [Malus domestica]